MQLRTIVEFGLMQSVFDGNQLGHTLITVGNDLWNLDEIFHIISIFGIPQFRQVLFIIRCIVFAVGGRQKPIGPLTVSMPFSLA